MKKSRISPVIRALLAGLVTLLVLSGSCTSRKGKTERKGLIPEDDLVPILTDLYLTDGILSIPKIRFNYENADSLSPYKDVIARHGYDKEIMDRTMRFYFVRKPKKLIRIYDKVLSHLSEMESKYQNEMPLVESSKGDLWDGSLFYHISDQAGPGTGSRTVIIRRQGKYTIEFTLTLFADDHIPAPAMGLYFCNPDSLNSGKRHYYECFPYLRDGKPHRYSVTVPLETDDHMVLRGWFVDMEGLSPDIPVHQIVEDISFTYSILRQ